MWCGGGAGVPLVSDSRKDSQATRLKGGTKRAVKASIAWSETHQAEVNRVSRDPKKTLNSKGGADQASDQRGTHHFQAETYRHAYFPKTTQAETYRHEATKCVHKWRLLPSQCGSLGVGPCGQCLQGSTLVSLWTPGSVATPPIPAPPSMTMVIVMVMGTVTMTMDSAVTLTANQLRSIGNMP